jgi:hypothetical protein
MVSLSYIYKLSLLLCFVSTVSSQQNFTGPGLVACLTSDYEAAPCLPVTSDFCLTLSGDDSCTSQNLTGQAEATIFSLPCDCASATNCPITCKFQPAPPNTTYPPGSNIADFRGPGYLSCPFADFNETQCSGATIDPTCSDLPSCDFNSNETTTADFENDLVYIPLICACYIVQGCPSSCERLVELPTLPPITSGRMDFAGVGTVTCPLGDIQQAQCLPTVDNNNTAQCGTCDPTIITTNDYIIDETNETVTFPLICECVVLLDCPDTCTFAAGLTKNYTAAPVAVPTATPVAVPTGTSTEQPIATPSATVPTGSEQPATVPVSAPSAPAPVPVSSPVAKTPVRSPVASPTNTNGSGNTSSAYSTYTHHTIMSVTGLVMMMFMSSFAL